MSRISLTSVQGHIVGETWGGGRGSMEINWVLARRFSGEKIRPLLERFLRDKGGDFEASRKFSEETALVVTVADYSGRYHTLKSRILHLHAMPSLADLVEQDS